MVSSDKTSAAVSASINCLMRCRTASAECAVHLDSKITLRAEASAPDAYASADEAALRMEKQLRRYHRRLKDHRC